MWRSITAVLLSGVAVVCMWFQSPLYRDSQPVAVSTTVAIRNTVNSSIICKGKIEDAGQNEVYPSTPVRVASVNVEVGDSVEAGQTLFVVETVPDSYTLPSGSQLGDMLGGELDQEAVVSVFNYLVNGTTEESSDGAKATYFSPSEEEKYYEITSPITGVVTQLSAEEDSILSPSVPCVTLSDPKKLIVKASVSENYVQDIGVGMQCQITGEAFRDRVYTGQIVKIMPYAKQTTSLTGTGETVVDVLVSIDSPDSYLMPGFSAKVKIYNDKHSNAILLPYECIWQNEDNEECVYVVRDGRARIQPIGTGYELEDTVEITEGIRPDDIVVINPPKDLQDGMKVEAAS